jgi:hypothetical protein
VEDIVARAGLETICNGQQMSKIARDNNMAYVDIPSSIFDGRLYHGDFGAPIDLWQARVLSG